MFAGTLYASLIGGTIEFSRKTIEQLRHYVYCLLDPRDNRIFYVGKGAGNRVFAHIAGALENAQENDKLSLIRDIQNSGNKVGHFILRHGIRDEAMAFDIESTNIDLLTYEPFSHLSKVTNIVSGHHTWDRGIKTVEEIEALYAAEPITDKEILDNVLIININRTYKRGVSPYEATRQHWKLDVRKAEKAQFVLSEFKGIFRAIYQSTKWMKSKERGRWHFEGNEVTDLAITKLYLNKAYQGKKRGKQIRLGTSSIKPAYNTPNNDAHFLKVDSCVRSTLLLTCWFAPSAADQLLV